LNDKAVNFESWGLGLVIGAPSMLFAFWSISLTVFLVQNFVWIVYLVFT